MIDWKKIENDVQDILEQPGDLDTKLEKVCKYLKENVEYYDWVGFYFVDPRKKDELVLGPYAGDPTIHTRIKFGEGICGQAAVTKKVFIVDDVSKEENYLACSPDVKSEIVVPIFKNGEIKGELDIDSHTRSAFTEKDRHILENIAAMISKLL